MRNRVVTCLALLCLAGSVIAQVANAPTTALSPLEQTLMGAEKSFVGRRRRATWDFSSAR